MILLDTDHFSVLTRPATAAAVRLMESLATTGGDDEVATSVITVEESFRGWAAEIQRRRDVKDQVSGYERLAQLVEFLANWQIVRFDQRAADEFARLRRERIRIGSQDLKIACIALSAGALLLSGNLRDFEQVPGLRVENWLAQ